MNNGNLIAIILGKVEVTVLNPSGLPEQVDCRFNNDKALTYSVSYIPKMEGLHNVYVKFSDRDVGEISKDCE